MDIDLAKPKFGAPDCNKLINRKEKKETCFLPSTWAAVNFKTQMTLMSSKPQSPRYCHILLVGGCLVLTAVN